jgi:hypothetical protein
MKGMAEWKNEDTEREEGNKMYGKGIQEKGGKEIKM